MKYLNLKNILSILIIITSTIFIYLFNNKIFFFINGFQKEIFQYPMYLLTTLVDGFIILMIAIAVYPFNKGNFLKGMMGFIVVAIIIQLLKAYFSSPRPPAIFTENLFVMGHAFKANSFPSGHSGTSLFFAGYFIQHFINERKNKFFIYVILTIAILSAISRVYIGVHFPIDVWVGGWIGFLTAKFFLSKTDQDYKFHENIKDFIEKYSVITVNIMGVITALLYLFYYKEKPEVFNFFLNPMIGILCLFFIIRIGLDIKKIC